MKSADKTAPTAKITAPTAKITARSANITAQPAKITPPSKIKPIAVHFDGGKLTSDAGVVLLQQVDLNIRLTERINAIISDPRNPLYTTHPQHDLIAQRLYAIALAYEDVNDHNQLRHDPALLAAIRNTTDDDQGVQSAECRVQSAECPNKFLCVLNSELERHACDLR